MNDFEYKDFGRIQIHLDKILKERNLSKSQLSYRCQMSRTQINRFCKEDITRLDTISLCKLCYGLQCRLDELIEYIPPQE
jgi:Predicted transcriptional regulator